MTAPAAAPPSPRLLAPLGALFAVSGACSLIYQVVWARQLAVHLGNTTQAHTVVIATFMAGLGIGYALAGRRADRAARPLRLYAALEAAITLWALAFPAILAAAGALAAPAFVALGPGHPLAGALAVALAAIALLVPTILMGATLPVLASAVTRQVHRAGPAVATLYAVNSAGAAVGVLAAGFWMLDALGLRGTLLAAAAANAAIAALAWLLARRREPRAAARPAETAAARPAAAAAAAPAAAAAAPATAAAAPATAAARPAETAAARPAAAAAAPSRTTVRLALAAAATAGFVSLALEGLWIRFFGVVLGSSTYAFSLVIAALIAGIALGAAGARRLLARGAPATGGLAVCALLAAAALLATGPWYARLPYELARLKVHLAESPDGFALFTLGRFGLVFALLAGPTVFFGALLPLAARAATGAAVAAGTGKVFAVNTLGAVLGVSLATPVLVPWLGLEGTLRACTALLAATGLGLLVGRAEVERRAWWLATVAAGLLLAVAALRGPGWDPLVLSAGAFRARQAPPDTFEAWRARLHRSTLVSYEDGPSASVAVRERGGERVLVVNGKPDASTRGDMLTQVASAHLPLLLHPNPRRALVIGLGSGVTVGSAARHGGAVDAVEISPAVVRASEAFRAASGDALAQPGVTLTIDDARSFLAASPGGYDVIISEPSNPWVAGNAGLFSVEFFSLARGRLAAGGLLAQWIHLYETDDEDVRVVLRTLGAVFPEVTLWELFPGDVLLIASAAPLAPDLDRLAARAAAPAIAGDLARVRVVGAPGLLSLQALGPQAVRRLRAAGPVNTDDRPRLEFSAPRHLFEGRGATLVRDADRRGAPTPDPELLLTRWLARRPLTTRQAQDLFVLHTVYPSAPERLRAGLLEELVAHSDATWLIELLFTLEREGWWEDAERAEARLLAIAPEHPKALYVVARARAARMAADGGERGAIAAAVAPLLARCEGLGDEPRGRCAGLRRELGE